MSDNKVIINIDESENVSIGDVSINNIQKISENEKKELLEKIEFIVRSQGNDESMEVYNGLKDEINKEKPKNAILRSLWLGLTTMLPALSQSVDIASKIIKLIGK